MGLSSANKEVHAGVGHCPHDDNPPLVNEQLIRWLKEHHT